MLLAYCVTLAQAFCSKMLEARRRSDDAFGTVIAPSFTN